MNTNITTPLLSFVPMLKKLTKVFCYMGLFFVASISQAAILSSETHDNLINNTSACGQSRYDSTVTDCDKELINTSPVNFTNNQAVRTTDQLTYSIPSGFDYRTDNLTLEFDYFATSTSNSGGNGVLFEQEHPYDASGTIVGCYVYYSSGVWKLSDPTFSSQTTLQTATSSLWYHIKLEYRTSDRKCRATINNVVHSWYNYTLLNATSTPYSSLEIYYISNGTNKTNWIDNLLIYTNDSYAESTSTPSCPTCTRIISHTPDKGETFPTIENIPIYSEVYVASSDVINQANIYVNFLASSIKGSAEYSGIGYGENDPQPNKSHQEQILIFDEAYQTFPYLVDFDFATGTYKMKIDIVEKIYPPWWQFWNDSYTYNTLATTEYEFYVLQPTDYEEMIQLSQQVIAQQEAMALTNDCAREGFVSQACFLSYGSELVNSIKYAPPHGYAFLLVDKLMATTTGTSSIAMLVSFPEGSPLRGHTLDLNMSSAIGNSISYIDNQDIETLPDGAMNTFMKYWNYFCYIMLGLWIVREVFGTFAFDFSYGGGNYQRSGQLEVTKARHKGSQPRMHIKSYD